MIMFSCFETILKCDRQTDGQTTWQTYKQNCLAYISLYAKRVANSLLIMRGGPVWGCFYSQCQHCVRWC